MANILKIQIIPYLLLDKYEMQNNNTHINSLTNKMVKNYVYMFLLKTHWF